MLPNFSFFPFFKIILRHISVYLGVRASPATLKEDLQSVWTDGKKQKIQRENLNRAKH